VIHWCIDCRTKCYVSRNQTALTDGGEVTYTDKVIVGISNFFRITAGEVETPQVFSHTKRKIWL
jgi:hypothetical protein